MYSLTSALRLIAETESETHAVSNGGGSESLKIVAYLIAAVCFIFSLGGLSQHETARRGNLLGILGMSLAIFVTAFFVEQVANGYLILIIMLTIGGVIGTVVASRVDMTAMPQLVAILHSFVGMAAVLVAISTYVSPGSEHSGVEAIIHRSEIFVGALIGGVTFTGSVIAWGKLQGKITSSPLTIPGRHWINLAMVVACVLLCYWFVRTDDMALGLLPLIVGTIISFVLGWHLVMAIGGADMPVVVSMLNSYSGWAAAATGFLLDNDLLIITGALVGSSGAILSYIMCRAMNRSFISVIMGGFGVESGTGPAKEVGDRIYTETFADEVAERLLDSKEVVVVPGYGMAVAQAQHPVREITELLKEKGIRTRFAIHPVAGRLPGHMNVLLAEARVPYDIVLEMGEINDDLPETDTVLVIGANDIVNPSAEDDPGSPIYGMPVLQVWKSGQVVILKRSMATGYSGIDNPLFYNENSRMLFGDAKKSIDDVLTAIRAAD